MSQKNKKRVSASQSSQVKGAKLRHTQLDYENGEQTPGPQHIRIRSIARGGITSDRGLALYCTRLSSGDTANVSQGVRLKKTKKL
ncbi:UNVERIFIED_CONTAM: hypothetical protein FKN15_002234 [Acipenser sinensis]